MNVESVAGTRLESECIIRDKDGNIKSCTYEVNDTLCGFPALGILELDSLNRIILQEIWAEMNDGRILKFEVEKKWQLSLMPVS